MHNYNGTFCKLSIDSATRFFPNFSLPPHSNRVAIPKGWDDLKSRMASFHNAEPQSENLRYEIKISSTRPRRTS
jgi:hypothetical protein